MSLYVLCWYRLPAAADWSSTLTSVYTVTSGTLIRTACETEIICFELARETKRPLDDTVCHLSAPVQTAAAATANASITSHSQPININANHTIWYCCVDYDFAIDCLQNDAEKGHQLIKFGWSPRPVHRVEGDELILLYTVKSNSIADLRYAELGLLYLAAAVWCFKSFSER